MKDFFRTLYEREREKTEKRRIHLSDRIVFTRAGLSVDGYLISEVVYLFHPRCGFHFGNPVLHNGHFARNRVERFHSHSQGVNILVARSFPRDCQLLPDIAGNNHDERQAHDEPHRLDGGV